MEVHYGNNEYAICLFRIQHAVWKSFRLAPSYFPVNDGPGLGMLDGTTDSGVNLHGKVETQVSYACLVVIDGFEELSFCLRVKGVAHASNRFHTLAKTCSPGIGFTWPERSSSNLR